MLDAWYLFEIWCLEFGPYLVVGARLRWAKFRSRYPIGYLSGGHSSTVRDRLGRQAGIRRGSGPRSSIPVGIVSSAAGSLRSHLSQRRFNASREVSGGFGRSPTGEFRARSTAGARPMAASPSPVLSRRVHPEDLGPRSGDTRDPVQGSVSPSAPGMDLGRSESTSLHRRRPSEPGP